MVTGKIKNVVDFGAFVDIGIKETALLHISELSDTYVSDPMEVLKVGDVKECRIIGLDTVRRRISLSLKSDSASRVGNGGAGLAGSAGGEGTKRKVVVRKAGTGSAAAKTGDAKPAGQKPRRDFSNSGSGDGMTYNPFAALLKK